MKLILVCLLLLNGVFASFFQHEPPLETCIIDHGANNTYDYIVVGAGSSGAVLASRLALGVDNDCRYSVLLIDAGPDIIGDVVVEMPGLVDQVYDYDLTSWPFFTQPEAFADNIRFFYPRAHAYGGCTTHNNMASVLPTVINTEVWVNATGEQAWNYTNRLAAFDAITATFYRSFALGIIENINTALGIPVNTPPPDVLTASFDAFAALGIPVIPPTSRPGEIGNAAGVEINFGAAIDITTGRRSYSGLAIQPSKSVCGPKFASKMEMLVTKVLMDGRRAIGVEALKGPHDYKIDPFYNATRTKENLANPEFFYANRGVILSGGFINTVQLMQLSGIGPKEQLEIRDIPMVKDLPGVGNNWEDDNELVMHYKLNVTSVRAAFGCNEQFNASDPCYNQWMGTGTGPYALNAPGFAFIPFRWYGINSTANFGVDRPDCIIVNLFGANFTSYEDYVIDTAKDADVVSVVIITPNLIQRGHILLQSADPTDPPLMFANYAEAEEDNAKTRGCIARVRELFSTPPFSEFVIAETRPGPQAQTDEELDAFIKETAWNHHGGGTCLMGNESNSQSVVNGRTKVWGLQNLRICDYSIAPQIADGFPQTDAMLIGHICAEMILEDDLNAQACSGDEYLEPTILNNYKTTHRLISDAGFGVWLAATILLGILFLLFLTLFTYSRGRNGPYRPLNKKIRRKY